jgi:thioesterase domain-containing protein/acyl carrier protein
MVEDGIFGNASILSPGIEYEDASPKLPGVSAEQAVSIPIEYPPTDLQREMWIAAQMRPEASAASNGSNVVEIEGELNTAVLEQSIAEVVARHESLRSTFSSDGAQVLVWPSMQILPQHHDLSALSPDESARSLLEILDQDGQQVFDLEKGPLVSFRLIKLSPRKHLFVFLVQMVVCDGWGFKVVLEEISKIYSGLVEKRDVTLERPEQMREYASWQIKDRDSASYKATEEFWLSKYGAPPPTFDLPAKGPRPSIRSYEAARANLRLNPDFYQEMKRSARELRTTQFALLLTAFSTWLYRLSGKDDFVIGVPFAGQGALGFNTLVGQCVHTLPFRFKAKSATPFGDQLNSTQKLIIDGQEFWNTNLGAMVQKLNLPIDAGRIPLAPVIFNLDPALAGVQFSGCNSRITSGPRFYFHYDLGFNVIDEGQSLLVECDYNSNLFDHDTINFWLAGFENLLHSIIANPNQQLGQISVLNESERPKHKTSRRTTSSTSDLSLKKTPEQFIAPRTEVEKRLSQIWQETLGLDRVSCRANFFELGGQSLAAVSLFSKIEKEFGKKLPLASLFRSPTIESLAHVLQDGKAETSWSPLVPISTKGSHPALFLVHGAGGNVLLYRSLGQHLAPDIPLYGLQSKGLESHTEPLRTIEEMADCYVRELRTVQPRGPYYLGGYCLGGTVAFEMAQMLRRTGEQVALVAMLDTYNYSRALRVSFGSFLLQKAKFHLGNMSRLRPKDMIEYLQEKMRLGLGGELANLKTSMPGASSVEGVSRATSGVEANVQAINDYAAEHYAPVPYLGRLTLFKPRFNYKFYPDPNLGWGDLALGGLEIVEVAVNPHAMLLDPYVITLAEQLKVRIKNGSELSSSQAELIAEEKAIAPVSD